MFSKKIISKYRSKSNAIRNKFADQPSALKSVFKVQKKKMQTDKDVKEIRSKNDSEETKSSFLTYRQNFVEDQSNIGQNVNSYSTKTLQGCISQSQSKINQDSFLVIKNFGNFKDVWLSGVFDGHGQYGHFVSNYIKENLPKYFLYEILDKKDLAHDLIGKNDIEIGNSYLSSNLTKK